MFRYKCKGGSRSNTDSLAMRKCRVRRVWTEYEGRRVVVARAGATPVSRLETRRHAAGNWLLVNSDYTRIVITVTVRFPREK